ncbi:MAG: hypothetical protein QOC92_695, partial [Acidimicrobiaceae bacterium]
MGGQRTYRLLFVALAIVLAGSVAVPPRSDRTRVSIASGPSTLGIHPGGSVPVAPPPPPPPRVEHPIQPPAGPSIGTTPDPAADLPTEPLFRDRIPITRAPITEEARRVFGLV